MSKVPVFESNSSLFLQSIWKHVSQERSGLVRVEQLETKKNGATKKHFVCVIFSFSLGNDNVINSHYSWFVSPRLDFLLLLTEKLSSTLMETVNMFKVDES